MVTDHTGGEQFSMSYRFFNPYRATGWSSLSLSIHDNDIRTCMDHRWLVVRKLTTIFSSKETNLNISSSQLYGRNLWSAQIRYRAYVRDAHIPQTRTCVTMGDYWSSAIVILRLGSACSPRMKRSFSRFLHIAPGCLSSQREAVSSAIHASHAEARRSTRWWSSVLSILKNNPPIEVCT
jgi:hypothetical protein